jgi:Core-2/I-Branching enzyme
MGSLKNTMKSLKTETLNNTLFSTTPMHSPSRPLSFLSVLFILTLGFVLGILTSFYGDTSPLLTLRSPHNFIEVLSPPPTPASPTSPPPPPSLSEPESTKISIANTTTSPYNETTAVVDDPIQLKAGYMEPKVMHNMTEEELFWKASMVPQISKPPLERKLKVAFLFLSRGELPFADLWDMFFKGHEGLYSIYWHNDPLFNGSVPEHSVFHGRRIPSKVRTDPDLNMFPGFFLKLHFNSTQARISYHVGIAS